MTLFLLTQHFPNNIQYFVTSGNNPIQKPLTREIPMNVLTKENFFRLNKSAWASLLFCTEKCQGCFDNINADQTRHDVGKGLLWKLVKTICESNLS